MDWKIIESGCLPPLAVMAKDALLLEGLKEEKGPILHLYDWEGLALTYGYFTDPSKYLDIEQVQAHGIRMAKRPTGGGITFHLTDFAFSVFIPSSTSYYSLNTLENYEFVNLRTKKAIQNFTSQKKYIDLLNAKPLCASSVCYSFCMSQSTQYDIILKGKKIGGAAQRKTKDGFLHQGSVFLSSPSYDLLENILKEKKPILDAMRTQSSSLLNDLKTDEELLNARRRFKRFLMKAMTLT